MKQEKRFVRVHTESSGFEVSSIWVDRKTGVSSAVECIEVRMPE